MTAPKTREELVRELWDAVNEYATACGGNPAANVYGNAPRQAAVCKVERAARAGIALGLEMAAAAAGDRSAEMLGAATEAKRTMGKMSAAYMSARTAERELAQLADRLLALAKEQP